MRTMWRTRSGLFIVLLSFFLPLGPTCSSGPFTGLDLVRHGEPALAVILWSIAMVLALAGLIAAWTPIRKTTRKVTLAVKGVTAASFLFWMAAFIALADYGAHKYGVSFGKVIAEYFEPFEDHPQYYLGLLGSILGYLLAFTGWIGNRAVPAPPVRPDQEEEESD